MKAQRLRFRYGLAAEACNLSQRELVTAWRDACAAAGLNVARSEGKRPSMMLSIAAPLPQGVTSTCELIDIFLADAVAARDASARIAPHLPTGIELLSVDEVGIHAPSVQSQVRYAEYELRAEGIDSAAVRKAICAMLEARNMPSEYRREKKIREYDMRALIIDLKLLADSEGCAVVVMRLRAEPERTARADLVASALNLPDDRQIQRTQLVLEEVPSVLSAYRRIGERDEG